MFGTVSLLVIFLFLTPAKAQEKFPSDTISILFGFGTGGTSDLLLRALADEMQKDLKVPVVVENKPGGGGVLAWSLAQKAKLDGYTLVYLSTSVIFETQKTKGKVDYRNFEPVVMLNSVGGAITVHKDAPYNTIEEFVAYAKANPGKIRVGNSGLGATWHVYALLLEKAAGIKFTHVPFKTAADCGTAILGKHIEASTCNAGDIMASLATGNLKVLATTGAKRDPFFPDVPTLKEKGIDMQIETWRAVGVRKGTPKERTAILEKAVLKAMEQPGYQTMLQKLKMPHNFLASKEFAEVYNKDGETLVSTLDSLNK